MKIIFFLFAFIVVVWSEQNANLQVVETPDYLSFDSKSPLKLSDFKNILLATSGFPVEKSVEWNGLKKTKTIEFPRITLLFILNNNQTDGSKPQSISVIQDTDLDFTYLNELSMGSETSVRFYDALADEKDVDCSALSSFHIFELSESVKENKIKEISKKVSEKCSNDLVSYVLLSNKPLRTKRQALNDDSTLNAKVANEAVFYSDQYPAMFNLIFWSSLILGLAVYGIVYGMWNMDPGLDTVIYRMTSQRIKKDQ